MKNILAAAALAASALAPTVSTAGPVYTLYSFDVLTWGCVDGEPACGATYGPNALDAISIGVEGNSGTLLVETQWDSFPTVGSGPYSNTNIPVANLGSIGTPVDFTRGQCMSSFICRVSANFSALGTGGLAGSLFTLNSSDMFEMTGDAAGLWTGRYVSDNGHTTGNTPDENLYIVYSGVWRAVPEPGSLALLGIAFAGLMFSMRRRHEHSLPA